jgi:hypothetical protein
LHQRGDLRFNSPMRCIFFVLFALGLCLGAAKAQMRVVVVPAGQDVVVPARGAPVTRRMAPLPRPAGRPDMGRPEVGGSGLAVPMLALLPLAAAAALAATLPGSGSGTSSPARTR